MSRCRLRGRCSTVYETCSNRSATTFLANLPPALTGLATSRRIVEAGHVLTGAIAEVTGSYDDAANIFHVLWLVRDGAGARPSAIAAATGLSSPGTVGFLDRMEAAGLVRRTYGSHQDGRAVVVTATPERRRAFDDATRNAAPVLDRVVEALFSV